MKRFLTSKLFSAFVALIMIAAAIALSLSSNTARSRAVSSSSQASWNIVTSPNNGTSDNELDNVVAISANNVWAVGRYSTGPNQPEQPLVEQWNGSSWNIATTPSVPSTGWLAGITVVPGTSDMWAVGAFAPGFGQAQTLIEYYNGSTWSQVSGANVTGTNNYLYEVAALSATDIWAVGDYWDTSDHTLIEHYDGTSWSVVASPNVSGFDNELRGIAAVSSSNIWAVGDHTNTNGFARAQTVIEHYDGTNWTIVQSPNVSGSASDFLDGTTVVSSSDIWAVGNYNMSDTGNAQPLAEHYDGTNWTVVATPSTNIGGVLTGVTAISSSDIWAVGVSILSGSSNQTLTEHFNGTSWSIVASPNTGSAFNFLTGVAAVSTDDIWAVGNVGAYGLNSNPAQTLIEHYALSTPPSPSPTPQQQRTKLFLLMPGFTSHLSAADASSGVIPADTFGQSNGIEVSLKNKFPGSRFVMFSYNGDDGTGKPTAYGCQDTLTRFMTVNVDRLKLQIIDLMQTYQNIDVYLVGHSYGGAVALALDADMKINGEISTNGGIVKGIITLDSPLGGVSGGPLGAYYQAASNYYHNHCHAATGTLYSLNELTQIFLGGPLYGSNNSLMQIVNGGDFSNQETADAEVGTTSVLAVGNIEDYLYAPRLCPGASLLPKAKFLSTQVVADQSSQMGVFGRIFVGGQSSCPSLTNLGVNHYVVLTNYYVKQGINQFVGNKPITSLAIPAAGFQ